MPIVKLPLKKKFDAACGVWASPQATVTLPLAKVSALVSAIKRSEGTGVGVALTGSRNQRMGVRSEAIYRAQAAVVALRKQLIQSKLKVRALKDKPLDAASFSDALTGFLILLASYLITSELPYRFVKSGDKPYDYEQFAKAYLPLNVKTPFPQVFSFLLSTQEQNIFRELFADGTARTRLFALAKPGATAADGSRKLFPTGPKVSGMDSVHTHQDLEPAFRGSALTWDDLIDHTLDHTHKGLGSRLLVRLSNPITIDKTNPRVALEMRRIGFASVFDNQWPGLVRSILKVVRGLR
jgi:hypothetical protein